jgi:hypothetical protein
MRRSIDRIARAAKRRFAPHKAAIRRRFGKNRAEIPFSRGADLDMAARLMYGSPDFPASSCWRGQVFIHFRRNERRRKACSSSRLRP